MSLMDDDKIFISNLVIVSVSFETAYNSKFDYIYININNSIMQMLGRMNAKLDLGWKMTTLSCSKCNNTTMAEPKAEIIQIYCPKCDKNYPIEADIQEEQVTKASLSSVAQDEDSKYYEDVCSTYKKQVMKDPSTSRQNDKNKFNYQFQLLKSEQLSHAFQKSNEVSKQIGQKLLQGWTMLNESCNDCMVPLMQSKKKQKICFGCNRDYAKKQEQEKPKLKQIQPKLQSKEKQKPEQKIMQKRVVSPQQNFGPNQVTTKTIVERIENRALLYLQKKMQRVIEQNDLFQLQRILSLVSKIKSGL